MCGTLAKETEQDDGTEEMGLGAEAKFGQVPLLRCSEAVLDGFEAEKTASHKEHRSFTALGKPVSELFTRIGSRCAQYHAPLPLIAFVRTMTKPSYLLCTAFAASSSEETEVDSTAAAVAAFGAAIMIKGTVRWTTVQQINAVLLFLGYCDFMWEEFRESDGFWCVIKKSLTWVMGAFSAQGGGKSLGSMARSRRRILAGVAPPGKWWVDLKGVVEGKFGRGLEFWFV